MTTLRVRTDDGEAADLTSPLQLAEQLHAAVEFVVVDRSDEAFAQAAVVTETGQPERTWVVEVVESPPTRQGVRADVPNTDAAYDLLRSWCNGDGWWADAFGWRPFGF